MTAQEVDLSPLRKHYERLRAGGTLGVLTGAGVSAESGLPTFRGAGGLWEGFRAEELATPTAFEKDPVKVWRFYEYRRVALASARPNPAHVALAALQRILPAVRIVTQNVDGLHQQAGSRDVVELHGSILRTRCVLEGTVRSAPATARFLDLPPYCPECGGLLRPDVVWFGEMLPQKEWDEAEEIAQQASVYIVAGTSSIVAPASSLGILAARGRAAVFEINPEETPLAPLTDFAFRASASAVLSSLVRDLSA